MMCFPEDIHFRHGEVKVIATPNLKQAADPGLGPETTSSVSWNSRAWFVAKLEETLAWKEWWFARWLTWGRGIADRSSKSSGADPIFTTHAHALGSKRNEEGLRLKFNKCHTMPSTPKAFVVVLEPLVLSRLGCWLEASCSNLGYHTTADISGKKNQISTNSHTWEENRAQNVVREKG